MMSFSTDTPVRVRYADTDQMKFVYYGKFFEYFEQGRSDLLRGIGLPYPEIESMGYYLPVIEAHAEYRRSSRYDDALCVRTILRGADGPRLRIEYEVRREGSGEILATGYTVHTFVSQKTGRPVRAPERFTSALNAAMPKGNPHI